MDMIPFSPLPDAVQWSEGMLLSPQHFQQNDIFWNQHLRHRIAAQNPHYWGVLQLRVSLIKEVISISALECILPDGLAVEFPGKSPRQLPGNLELPVGSQCTVNGGPLKVWLWVRERDASAARQDDSERRYNSIIDTATADENTGENMFPIERLQVHFELYLGTSSPAPTSALALLEVVRGANEVLSISSYHPPMLHLEASKFQQDNSLQRQLDRLHEMLWIKITQLSAHGGAKNSGDSGHENHMESGVRQHLAVARHLASCLPALSIQLYPQCHPYLLYQAIAQVVGQLACIGANPLPLRMQPYRHADCLPQFQAAFEYIEAQLATVDITYEIFPFARVDKPENGAQFACFARRLMADMNEHLIIELKPRETQTRAQLANWISQAMIASEALMPQLLRARLQGASVRELTPHEISHNKLRPQAALFLIQNQKNIPHGDEMISSFSAEQSLLIQGKNNADLPAAILLYRRTAPLSPEAPGAQKKQDAYA